MLARLRKSAENKDSGFTLIELLVVMIIIGILAAIAIPAFLNQKKKARETSAKADVTTIGKEVAAYYVDAAPTAAFHLTGATATWALGTTGTGAGANDIATGKLSAGNVVSTTEATGGDTFCVAVATSDGVTWAYKAAEGLVKDDCV